jgi:amidophosphoribosyltransferase
VEGLRDESGVVAISGSSQAAQLVLLGLSALQHRGAHGAGIAASDGHLVRSIQGRGSVPDVFAARDLSVLRAVSALGQVWGRGERTNDAELDAQTSPSHPFIARFQDGQIAVAVSGRFANRTSLRKELKATGALFSTMSDGELLLHLLARSRQTTTVNRLVDALWKVEGAFNVVVLTEDRLIAVRDPRGFRPLWAAQIGTAVGVASEDTALRLAGATDLREIEPGEMLIVDENGPTVVRPLKRTPLTRCTLEVTTTASQEARAYGHSIYQRRVALGRRLASESPVDADLVLGVPGVSVPAALGFARGAALPFEAGISQAMWAPEAAQVLPGVDYRWQPVPSVVEGQRVVLVVSAIGDGRDIRKLVQLLRDHGALAVHIRAIHPAIVASCPYGTASPTVEEIVAPRGTDAATFADSLRADSVACLTREGLTAELGSCGHCLGCVGGNWPVLVEAAEDQLGLFDGG